jgi:hypothetical protein
MVAGNSRLIFWQNLYNEKNMTRETLKEGKTVRCTGACHCGRVRFSVNVPVVAIVHQCNCSICQKSGFVHLIVEAKDMEILSGKDELSEYRFNTGVARHLFCRNCGIKAFYVPRSHPHGYSVNLNCVELEPGLEIISEPFDGQQWEQNISGLE